MMMTEISWAVATMIFWAVATMMGESDWGRPEEWLRRDRLNFSASKTLAASSATVALVASIAVFSGSFCSRQHTHDHFCNSVHWWWGRFWPRPRREERNTCSSVLGLRGKWQPSLGGERSTFSSVPGRGEKHIFQRSWDGRDAHFPAFARGRGEKYIFQRSRGGERSKFSSVPGRGELSSMRGGKHIAV